MAPISTGKGDNRFIHPTFGIPAIKQSQAMETANLRNYIDQKHLKSRMNELENEHFARKADIFRTRRSLIDILTTLKDVTTPDVVDFKCEGHSERAKRVSNRSLQTVNNRKNNINNAGNVRVPDIPRNSSKRNTTLLSSKKNGFTKEHTHNARKIAPENITKRSKSRGLKVELDRSVDSDAERERKKEAEETRLALERRSLLREERRTRNMFQRTLVNVNRRSSSLLKFSDALLDEVRQECAGNNTKNNESSSQNGFVDNNTQIRPPSLSRPCSPISLRSITEVDLQQARHNLNRRLSSAGLKDRPISGSKIPGHKTETANALTEKKKSKVNVIATWRRNTWDNFRQLDKIREDIEIETSKKENGTAVVKEKAKLVRRHTEPAIGNEKPYKIDMNPKIHAMVDVAAMFSRIDDIVSQWKNSPPVTAVKHSLYKDPGSKSYINSSMKSLFK